MGNRVRKQPKLPKLWKAPHESKLLGSLSRSVLWILRFLATTILAGLSWWALPHLLPGPDVRALYTIVDRGQCFSLEVSVGGGKNSLDRLEYSAEIPAENPIFATTARSLQGNGFFLVEPIIVGESNGHCVFATVTSDLPPNMHYTVSKGVPRRLEVQATDFTGMVVTSVLVPKKDSLADLLGPVDRRPTVLDGSYRFTRWGISVEKKLTFTRSMRSLNVGP